jgi:hypothetical protein
MILGKIIIFTQINNSGAIGYKNIEKYTKIRQINLQA